MYVQLQNRSSRRRPRQLGDLSTSGLTAGVTSGLSGAANSPFLYIVTGLLLWFAISKGRDAVATITGKPVRRKRKKTVPAFTAAVYSAGALVGGYLIGKYTGL